MKKLLSLLKESLEQGTTSINQLEEVVTELETAKIDVTSKGKDNEIISKIFSRAFDEEGRDLFLRICALNESHVYQKCEAMYSDCSRDEKGPETLFTLYHKIKIAVEKREEKPNIDQELRFPNTIYPKLPKFLKEVLRNARTQQEKDALLLGSITTISACLPNYFGIYDKKKVYSNLFLFVVAKASAGKSILSYSRDIVKPINEQITTNYSKELKAYAKEMKKKQDQKKGEYVIEPDKPKRKKLFIPANNSSTGVYQNLSDNGSRGLMFETEGDTLTQALKTDYGNYSDGFRKAFHHEPIAYSRRTNDEDVSIEEPRLSVVLSGTPAQLSALVPNPENGLFSRFVYYKMKLNAGWNNVFSSNNLDTSIYYKGLGDKFLKLFNRLENNSEVVFKLTQSQEIRLNKIFEELQTKYISLIGVDFLSVIRRNGLIMFRMAMVLSILRLIDKECLDKEITCQDEDFDSVVEMIKVLIIHSKEIYNHMPKVKQHAPSKSVSELFLDSLPIEFNRAYYLDVANSLNIKSKTAEYNIKKFEKAKLIRRHSHNHYIKCELI